MWMYQQTISYLMKESMHWESEDSDIGIYEMKMGFHLSYYQQYLSWKKKSFYLYTSFS